MPSGRVHSATSAALAGLLYYLADRAGLPAAPLAGGCLAGIMLTPDLDVDGMTRSDTHARRLGGLALALPWYMIWRPYAFFIPHRSPLSHWPLLGTALRLVYLGGLVAIIARLVGMQITLPLWWPWTVAGLAVSDLAHFILDKTVRIKI